MVGVGLLLRNVGTELEVSATCYNPFASKFLVVKLDQSCLPSESAASTPLDVVLACVGSACSIYVPYAYLQHEQGSPLHRVKLQATVSYL